MALVAAVGALCSVLVPSADVRLYHHYANLMWHGSLAAALPKEYPAPADAVFLLPSFVPASYGFVFGALMAAAFVGLLTVGVKLIGDAWGKRTLVYLVLGTVAVMFTRFDLLPATCAFIAVVAAGRRRFGTAWVAAGLGAALKLFPALLLPGFFIYEWKTTGRPPWRRAAVIGLVTVALAGLQSVVAPGTVWGPVRYEAQRGFELSSVPGSLTLLIDPGHLRWIHAFGTWQVVGSGHAAVSAVMTALEIALLISVWSTFLRQRFSVEACSLAVLSIAVMADRALAPQYLLWLVPLWALWPLRRSWMAASILTFLTFPIAYAVSFGSGTTLLLPTAVAFGRNVALLAGTVAWAREELRRSGHDLIPTTGPDIHDSAALSIGSAMSSTGFRHAEEARSGV